MSKDEKNESVGQKFGGPWTIQKLEVLKKYLGQYTTALKNQKFKKAYIDAFAGTGYIDPNARKQKPDEKNFDLYNTEDISEFKELHEGSARMALSVEPRFNKYIYIDNNPKKCVRLKLLQEEFPNHDIDVFECEANRKIQELCNKNWKFHRAVMFLDPFGMHVDWETIKSIAYTEAIDLWLFFPIGLGVNRQLKKSGKISDDTHQLLNKLFGTEDWYREFYDVEESLFGDEIELITKKTNPDKIGKFYNQRLKEIFAGVIETPVIFKNSKNSPIFQLFFAVGNQKGKEPALRIARNCMKLLAK